MECEDNKNQEGFDQGLYNALNLVIVRLNLAGENVVATNQGVSPDT
jgi:hypothetical protein